MCCESCEPPKRPPPGWPLPSDSFLRIVFYTLNIWGLDASPLGTMNTRLAFAFLMLISSPNCHSQELVLRSGDTRCQLVFASRAEASQLLTQSDDFVARLSPFDRGARLKTDQAVDEVQYLRFVGQQTLDWAESQRQQFSRVVEAIQDKLAGLKLPLPEKIWLIKTTGLEEGGAAYTRGAAIVFPQRKVSSSGDLTPLFCHELFHVMSRNDPAWRDRLYSTIGFRRCPELQWPDNLALPRLTNPDAPVNNHCIKVRLGSDAEAREQWVIPILYSRAKQYDPKAGGEFFDYLTFRLIGIDEPPEAAPGGSPGGASQAVLRDGKLILLEPKDAVGFLDQIGRNTGYIIHPDEILADNFVMIVTGKADIRSPEVLEKIKSQLSK